ncbi:pentapeptide repeat-containing protein [Chamaesiphon sp. GL140_3_metabinner_50]|nr:pentapeptide repeat-containing protein [Chamaesiphon sp. GL140_3_metabinner_50]
MIARRKIELETDSQYLDLSFTNLRTANLIGANLDRTKLISSSLI